MNNNNEALFASIANVGEERLTEAMRHASLVGQLAYMLAEELGKNDSWCYTMKVAGMVHDVGKLKLHQYLNSSGKQSLMVEQLRYTRTHPTFGYLALKEYGYPEEITQAVLHHHENFDGSGYPDNLQGYEIPMGARVLRICDTFAALIEDRSYRKAFEVKAAVELMIEEVKNFDMEMFLAFLRLVHEVDFGAIKEKLDQENLVQLKEEY